LLPIRLSLLTMSAKRKWLPQYICSGSKGLG
jgi:hypothetical protein